MKHKICFLILIFLGTACEVALKDKATDPPLVEVQAVEEPDYVIDGPLLLTTHTKIEAARVVLTKKAVITTEDKNLLIIAKQIVSDGAVIRNYPEGAEAYWEMNGRSGGTISIDSEKAQGVLNVQLNAERGGHGKNGCIVFPQGGHPGCAGSNGAKGGNAGNLRLEILDNTNFNLNWTNIEGEVGLAGVRGSVDCRWGGVVANNIPCLNDSPEGINGTSGGKGQVCIKLSSEDRLRCQE